MILYSKLYIIYGYYTIEDNSGRFYKREKYPIIIKNIEEVTKNE